MVIGYFCGIALNALGDFEERPKSLLDSRSNMIIAAWPMVATWGITGAGLLYWPPVPSTLQCWYYVANLGSGILRHPRRYCGRSVQRDDDVCLGRVGHAGNRRPGSMLGSNQIAR